jgi:hypothetical protein
VGLWPSTNGGGVGLVPVQELVLIRCSAAVRHKPKLWFHEDRTVPILEEALEYNGCSRSVYAALHTV